MNENYIDDLYKNITSKDESFSGKFNLESFREKISTNPAYAARMHTWLSGVDEDFELPVDRFIEEVSTTVDPPVKKKSGMESSSADGSVDSPFTTLDEPYLDKPRVDEPKEKTEKEIADFKKFYEKVPEEQALEEDVVGISEEEAAAADVATFPEYEKFGQSDATALDIPMGQALMEEEAKAVVEEGKEYAIKKEQQKEYFERKESGEDVNYLYNEILYKEEIEAEKEKIKKEEERKSKGYTSIELKAIDNYSKINPGRSYEDDMSLYDEYEELTDFVRFIDDYRKNPSKKKRFEDLTDKEKEKYGPTLYYNGEISLNIDEIYNKLDNEREKLSDEYLDDDIELARDNYDQSVIRENKERIDKAVSINNKAKETTDELDVISNNLFGFGYKELLKYNPKTKGEAESQENIIKKLIEVKDQQQIAADIYENSKLYFSTRFDTENNLELLDNYEGVMEAYKSAEAQGKAGEYLLQLAVGIIPDDEESIYDVATKISKLLSEKPEKKSRAMKRWEQSYGGTAGLDVFLDNPIELMASLAASSISQMLPLGMKIIPATTAAGGAMGAQGFAAGPQAGLVSTVSGVAKGFVIGQAAVNAAMEYTNELLEAVKFFGYKVTEPGSLAIALQDQRVWDRGLERGGTRGAVIGLADAFSGGMAGKMFKVGSLASRGKRIAAAVTERLVMDPLLEGVGEGLAQKSVGDDLDMKDVFSETLGSAGSKQANAMINVANQTRAKNRIDLANKLTDINFISQELSSDKRITDWANNMQRLGKISPETNQRIQKNVGLRRDAKELSVIAGLANKNKKVRARIMTLLAAKEDLSSTKNRRSIFGEKIREIDAELASTVETGNLIPQEEQVILAGEGVLSATEQASATDIREGLPEYKIKKGIRGRVVPVTKNEFLKAVEKSDYKELAELNAEVINDDDTKTILNNKIKKGVEKNDISEIESKRAEELANDINNEDTEAINNYYDNEIEKVKYRYGIQEQSTETVDAPKPAESSPTMGGTVPPKGTFTEPAESQVDKTEQQVEEEKAEVIETFFEGEPSEDVNKVSGNLSINKTGEGTQKKSRFRNRVTAVAVKAAKSISKIIPETKIILHESNDEYLKYAKTGEGRGEYNPVQDIIHVNLSNATISTLPHEVFHAVLLNKVKNDEAAQKIAKKMVDSVRKTLPDNNELAIAIDKFAARYTGKKAQLQDEERISELIGLLASKEFGYSTLSKPAKNSIIEFFKNLANRFGIKLGTDFGKTDESVIDLINTIAKKTVEGEVIEPSEIRAIEELDQGTNPVGNPTTIVKPSTRKQIAEIGFKDSYENSLVSQEKSIDIDALVDEIAEKDEKVWFWVADQLGIDEEMGIDGGPSFAHQNPNDIWASSMPIKSIENNISKAEYIFIISGSPTVSKLFNKSAYDFITSKLGDFNTFKEKSLETNPIKVIKENLGKYNSWEKLRESTDRKPFLIALNNSQNTPNAKFTQYVNSINGYTDLNTMRDGFYAENGFEQNDIMLVLKPTGVREGSNHSTYENTIEGEVVGVPNKKIDALNIMPEAMREKLLSKSQASQVIAPYGSGIRKVSKRKQIAEKKSTPQSRQQIIGESAELSDNVSDNYMVANQMEKANKSSTDIRVATGWERGADGKWRYEIDDVLIKDDFSYKDLKRIPSGLYSGKLSDVINNEKLFDSYSTRFTQEVDILNDDGSVEDFKRNDNYPPISDIKVYFEEVRGGTEVFAEYDPLFKTITINIQPGNSTNEQISTVLLHEIQHYIQGREGFAKGGNTEIFENEIDTLSFGNVNALRSFAKDVAMKNPEKGFNITYDSDAAKKYEETFGEKPSPTVVTLASVLEQQLSRGVDINKTTVYKTLKNNNLTSFEKYERLAGEVEARNVQKRIDMTPEQRRNTLLESTEDVAREDQIFLKDQGTTTRQSRQQRTERLAPNGKQSSRQQKIDKALSKASGTTQVATTTGSYVKAANILKNLDIKGEVLDFGAGLGLGTDAMSKTLGSKVDSYEINPERWKGDKPVTYTKVEDINKKYDAIVSLNVLNVVPKEIRDGIVRDIYSNLKPGGTAVISTRGFKGDINSAKNFELGPEEKSYIIKRKKVGGIVDVYQKGFDGNELVEYIQDVLGDKVKVENKGGFGSRGVIVQKLDGAIPKVAKATRQQNFMVRQQKGLINFTEKDAIKFSKIGISDARTIQAMNSIGLSGVKFNKEGVDKKIKESLNTLYKNYESYLLSSDSNEITRLMQFDIDAAIEDGLPTDIINRLKEDIEKDEARKRFMSKLIATQDETANQWVSYFKESDYSDAFKYLMLDAVLTNNYDLKSLKYKKRTNTTTRNISPFDAGTLATLYASDSKNLLKSYVEIQQENLKNIINASKIKTTDKGKWLKFDGGPQATNIEETSNSLSQLVQDTYWCTKTNALSQLRDGDFYVYVTGKTPRIAIRMEGNEVGEVRGNASSKQDLEGDMLPVAEKFLKNNIPNDSGKKWLNSISFNKKAKKLIENIKTNGIGEKEIIDYTDIISEGDKYNTDYGENGFVTKLKDIFRKDKLNPEMRGFVAFGMMEFDPNATKYLISKKDANFENYNIKDLGKLEYIVGNAYFRNSKVESLGNLKSISGGAYFEDSNIESLGNLKSIGREAYFDDSKVESLGNLESIGGTARFSNSKIKSLGNLKSISGTAYFRNSNIKDLGNLESIGSDARFMNSKVESLGNLKSIGGFAYFGNSNIKDLGNLESIGEEADFEDSNVKSLGNLESIGGDARFNDSKVESLGNLKSISGSAYFRNSNIKDLGNLESIGRDANFYNSKVESLGNLKSIGREANFKNSKVESLGNLKSIGRDATFSNSKIKSLGNLESIVGYADFYNSKVESLGNLESINGEAYFEDSNIESLGNLKYIGGNARFKNSNVKSLGNLESIGGYASFNDSKVKSLGNLEYIGREAYFNDSNVESLGNLESIGGYATFGDKLDLQSEWRRRKDKPATRQQMAEEDTTPTQSTEDIIKDFNTQIKKDFPDIYHPDGRLKSKPTRKADSEIIFKSLKEDGVVSGLKSMLSNYVKKSKESTKAGVQSVIDFMQNYVSNSKTILNILDRGKEGMFTNLFYNKLNRMEEATTKGILEKEKDVDSIINNILGGNKTYRKWKFSLGTKKIEINGITDKNNEGERTPLQVNLNKEEAMNLYAMWLNTDGGESAKSSRELLERQGYTNEKIKKVKEFIGTEQVAIVEGIVDFLSSKVYSEIAPIYKNEMGEDFLKRENYFPRRAVRDIDLTDKSSGADFRSEFQQEYVTALKPLLNSESDLEVKGRSFLDILENHIATTERVKAYAEGVRELSDVYNSADVQAILEETSTKPLLDFFLGISINPNSGATGNNKFISTIYRNIQGYFLALNLQQALRQASSILFGFTSYKFKRDGKNIPFRDILGFAYDISEVLATLPKQIKQSKDISATFKKRIRKSLGGDIAGIESGGRISPSKLIRSQGIKGKVARGFSSAKNIFNAIGDIVGIMGYKAAYNRNIKNGMSKAEALEAFNKYNETQGSTRNTDKNRLQLTDEPILKAFTLFGSVVYLNLNNSVQAVNSIYKQILKGKPGKMEDYRKLALNYSIGSGVYTAVAHLPQLLSSDEEDREYALSKIAEAMLGLNLLYKVPILGAALESMLNKFDSDGAINPIVTIVKDVKTDLKKAEKENKNDPKYIKAVSKTVIEFAAGAKSDAPIALYNLLVDDVDDKESAGYDAIGVSKSYRPGYGQKESKGGFKGGRGFQGFQGGRRFQGFQGGK
jgi:SAM-dependent methyltransferase